MLLHTNARLEGSRRCCSTPWWEPEGLVDNGGFCHRTIPVHFSLVVNLHPDRIAGLAVRRSHCAYRNILLADRGPDRRRNETDLAFIALLLLKNIGAVRRLVARNIEFHEPPRGAIALLFCQRTTAIEVRLLKIDKPIETELER